MLLDTIFKKIGGKTGRFHGLAYELTEGNSYLETLDTPQLWGHAPDVLDYRPAGMNLVNKIRDIIGNAKYTVDISTLSHLPDGKFLEAIKTGIKDAVAKGNYPVIRLLEGVYFDNITPPWTETVTKKLQKFLLSLDIPNDVPVYAAAMQTELTAWNHSKLIIVDGEKAISGGHNLWHKAYCEFAPIHDLSINLSGPCLHSAQTFLNKFWSQVSNYSRGTDPAHWCWSTMFFNQVFYYNALPVIAHTISPQTGDVRVLSLGKLGGGIVNYASPDQKNPSRRARIEAIKLAKEHVRMSQQMLGSFANASDNELLDAIASHVAAGKHFSLIMSDAGATNETNTPYSGYSIEFTGLYIAKKVYEMGKSSWTNYDEFIKHLETYLHIAPVRISDKNINDKRKKYWGWRKKPQNSTVYEPGNHCKFYMIDEDVFYVGSDNAYEIGPIVGLLDGLPEFGFMIEGKKPVEKILTDYWNKAWQYSSQFKVSNWKELLQLRTFETPDNTAERQTTNEIIAITENKEGEDHE